MRRVRRKGGESGSDGKTTNNGKMRLGGGSSTAGTLNYRHTNPPVCMQTHYRAYMYCTPAYKV